MCPPAKSPPPPEIDQHWNNEQIILFLDKDTGESDLPCNVQADLSPYQHLPSTLREGIWYIVYSSEKKESVYGFWKAKGEPEEIYSDTRITGWKTSLEYFEGQTPHRQKTDWVMKEYSITRKELCDNDKTKESRLLCQVFLCSGHSSESEMQPHNCKIDIESKELDLLALASQNISSPSGGNSISESKVKPESERGAQPEVHDKKTSFSLQDFDKQDCILEGDFLELNDLADPESVSSRLDCISRGDYIELNDFADPESVSSSSQNSSCTSNLSDKYFDSEALLREMEEDKNICIQQEEQSNSAYSFAAAVRPGNIVLQPAPSGSHLNDAEIVELLVGPQTASPKVESLIHKTPQKDTTKRHNSDSTTEGAETTSTGHKNAGPSGEKKAGSGSRLKKLKLFFCFTF